MRLYRCLLPILGLLAACSPSDGHSAPQGAFSEPLAQTPALAEPTRRTPADAFQVKASFAPVVKKAAPAVVNVFASSVVRQQVDPFWELFSDGAPRERVQQSLGSGVIVRADGIIITNNHVIAGGQQFKVALADKREFPAKVLLADARIDLAVLKIDVGAERLPVLAIDDRPDVQVGDLVLAIGNPFGVGQTVTNGIISALNRSDGEAHSTAYIQTDAAINPGNSGGALVNMDGDLIGINTMIISRSGSSAGVGFAIPAAMVKRVVESAAGGAHRLVRPWLGAKLDTVTSEIAKSLGLPRPQGALVSDLYPGSSAAKAGLKLGDVVTAINGQAEPDAAALQFAVGAKRPGDALDLSVLRDGKPLNLHAVAQPAPATPEKDERRLNGDHPLNGATVVNLSPALAEEYGLDPFTGRGVVITALSGRSYAAGGGFAAGDFVREINNEKIVSVKQLQEVLAQPSRLWTITIERQGQRITGQFRG